ncbi:DNA-binding transcription factor yap1 [Gnomoniopsis smithogilvyi]|uniref:DNA-binding transcription factor yap1 n=1 Tax=Gnomoniopsis smithogilvyi TaxID=1191159 RepID=A0A9W9CZ18_9PEZI|nr:DNA-binding transcription factor yap1 [Gnomoniopsis smithogilvyi]
MASTRNPLNTDFILTPQQQSLLFAALNSNRQPNGSYNGAMNPSPVSYNTSPQQDAFQESPLVDYDYEFTNGDTSYDFSFADDSQAKMIGDLPGSNGSGSGSGSDKGGSENNDNEKRSHPDDDDDEEANAKRQETGEKVAKKPGRKPLTTEPTSKRKAQNRAAQRAFRERKEKHVKDLEIKVEELEKASQSTNQENSKLRAQVEKMTLELAEYKKRLSLVSNTRTHNLAGKHPTFGNAVIGNLNDVNFQFEFPKFGQLPGPAPSQSTNAQTNGRPSASPSRTSSDQISPSDTTRRQGSTQSNGLDTQTKDDLAKFSGIFSPPLTDNVVASAARGSTTTNGAATSSSSPSASSNSNCGPSSSCGTSPEPTNNQSPVSFKPEALGTIGEEIHPSLAASNQGYGHFANIDLNNMSFLNGTNDFQFDPQLFGGYREPQQNILNSGLDDGFFNDAFDIDFTTPYFAPSPAAPKKDLMTQIDEAKNDDQTELVATDDGQYLTCNKIWEKLQNCPKVQNGDFDLDGLCSDLQKKARCSGSGAVVDERTFQNVMKKYLGNKGGDCPNDIPPEVLQAPQPTQAPTS